MTEYVFDEEGKIRFSQSAVQRNEGGYSLYDEDSRLVESGVYQGIAYVFQTIDETPVGNVVLNITVREHYLQKLSYNDSYELVYKTWYVRDVNGNVMSVYQQNLQTGGDIVQSENPVYGASRVGEAMYNKANDTWAYYYELTDHLGNVRAVITDTKVNGEADDVQYAEYYPFGMQMPGRLKVGIDYRYQYQGQYAEADDEVGLSAFKLRMYDARIARWISPDPYGQYASPYVGMGNSPNGVDVDGGLFGLSTSLSTLVGAGIGFGIGSSLGLLLDKDNWWKYGIAGAFLGGTAGFLTGNNSYMGSKSARSKNFSSGKVSTTFKRTRVGKLKYPKFNDTLSKEFTLFNYKERIFYGPYMMPFQWGINLGSKFSALSFSFSGNGIYDGSVFRNNRDISSFSIGRDEVTSRGNARFLFEGETFMSGLPQGQIKRFNYQFEGDDLIDVNYSVQDIPGPDQFAKVKIKAQVRRLTHLQYTLLRNRGWKL